MDANEFYELAENLMSSVDHGNEASYRTIVGRAYYAVYLLTRDWMDECFTQEVKESEGKSHEKYTNCLKGLQRKKMDIRFSTFAFALEKLKNKRHFADYDLTNVIGKVNAKEAVLSSKKLIGDLDCLKKEYSPKTNE